MDISPIAHVALLHTDMNSGFRLAPRMGMKSAENFKTVFLSNQRKLEFCQN